MKITKPEFEEAFRKHEGYSYISRTEDGDYQYIVTNGWLYKKNGDELEPCKFEKAAISAMFHKLI